MCNSLNNIFCDVFTGAGDVTDDASILGLFDVWGVIGVVDGINVSGTFFSVTGARVSDDIGGKYAGIVRGIECDVEFAYSGCRNA